MSSSVEPQVPSCNGPVADEQFHWSSSGKDGWPEMQVLALGHVQKHSVADHPCIHAIKSPRIRSVSSSSSMSRMTVPRALRRLVKHERPLRQPC